MILPEPQGIVGPEHHIRLNLTRDDAIELSNCNKWSQCQSAIIGLAVSKYPLTDDESKQNCGSYAGNLFELFGEFFCRFHANHPAVAILDYHPTNIAGESFDSIDGKGRSLSNLGPKSVQFKFVFDPNTVIDYTDKHLSHWGHKTY